MIGTSIFYDKKFYNIILYIKKIYSTTLEDKKKIEKSEG